MNTRIADLRVGQIVALLVIAGILVGGFFAIRHADHQQAQVSRNAACDNSAPLNSDYNLYLTLCKQGKINP